MRAINKPGTSIARMAGSHGKTVPLDENVIPQSARLKERHPGICRRQISGISPLRRTMPRRGKIPDNRFAISGMTVGDGTSSRKAPQ